MGVDSRLVRVKILSKKRGLFASPAAVDNPLPLQSTASHRQNSAHDSTSNDDRSPFQRQQRSMASVRKQQKYRQGFGSFADRGGVAVLPSSRPAQSDQDLEEEMNQLFNRVRGSSTRRPNAHVHM